MSASDSTGGHRALLGAARGGGTAAAAAGAGGAVAHRMLHAIPSKFSAGAALRTAESSAPALLLCYAPPKPPALLGDKEPSMPQKAAHARSAADAFEKVRRYLVCDQQVSA